MMLKKFLNYQKLLSYSTKFTSGKKRSKSTLFLTFILMYILIIFMITFGEGGFIFYPTVSTLFAVYSIITAKNKLYEVIPVSKLYLLTNIYLYVFISIYVATTLLLIAIMLFTQLNLTLGMNLPTNSWKTILVIYCITSIIASISLPIFFIKLNFLRKLLTILIIVFIPIVLLFFKNTLPVVTELDKVYFWESITIMPNYNEYILACICVVILPISMLISYKLYKGKRCTTC
ncbi:ABC-2 transporter permease [Clostridium sp.]|uniref:ABC-2 transporter permease n=1 Tax=Clostridium sp. TaxID=1506 RepID=UPI003D6D8E45